MIGGVTWRIVDINYYYGLGDTAFNTNHLVIMPDTALYQAKMHGSGSTSGGYVGSQMYTANLNTAKTTIASAFPSAVLTHRDFFSSSYDANEPNMAWYNSTVNLPNESMFFGAKYWGVEKMVVCNNQLSLFRLKPNLRVSTNAKPTWFSNMCNSTDYAGINEKGFSDYYTATDTGVWVRPVFCIG